MKIYQNSLAQTVDSVNDAFFFDQPVTAAERDAVALWIAKRQGLPGAYANMFAPTDADARSGIRLFTGERLGPSASLRHVSGEEACRALVLLESPLPEVKSALKLATEGMRSALQRAKDDKRDKFCCGTCDPALWRHITSGGLKGSEEWLSKGMKVLKGFRDGNGRWQRFPFYFTLLALSEIDLPAARSEIRYAAGVCERLRTRTKLSDSINRRRIAVLERVLSL